MYTKTRPRSPLLHGLNAALVTVLTACGGYGSGNGSMMTTMTTVTGPILSTLSRTTTIGSTLDPVEHGGNPYGLTVATATSGLVTAGDLLICNFNDGSTNNGLPGSISAPAGLTYESSNDTLYVVDTNANRVVALTNVSAIGTDGVIVTGSTFTGASASSAKVIASGAPLNGPISAALLVNGDLVVGNTLDAAGTNLLIEISPTSGVVAMKNVDTGAGGALFGNVAVPVTVATGTYTSTTTDTIYFNDDNDNTVKLLSQ